MIEDYPGSDFHFAPIWTRPTKPDGDGAQSACPTETVTEATTDDGDVYSLVRISEKKRAKLLRLLEALRAEVEEP